MTRYELTSSDGSFDVQIDQGADGFRVKVGESAYLLKLKRGAGRNQFVVEVADKPVSVILLEASSQRVNLMLDGERLSYLRPAAPIRHEAPAPQSSGPAATTDLAAAPMPGKVIGVLVKRGERVKTGDPLVILESMKMEMAVRSDRDAEVTEILVDEGAPVKRGQGLVRLG